MPFQIKDFASITASELNHARAVTDKITDFAPGSVVRTIIESPAVEIEQLYMQFFLGLRDAIPTATFRSFGFNLLPAAFARGFVTVFNSSAPNSNVVIPINTQFTTTDGRIYYSSAATTWLAHSTSVRIPIIAAAAGAKYNAASGVINDSPYFDSSYTITNSAITTGRDAESDLERETRFSEYVTSLSRGTFAACLYAVKQATVKDESGNIVEYVSRVGSIETPGYVAYYLYGSGGIASTTLIANAQALLDGSKNAQTGVITPGYRPAGVDVQAILMVERAVSSTFSVGMFPGYTLNDTVKQTMTAIYASALTAVQPGNTLYIGTLVDYLLGVAGVQSVVPAVNQNIICGHQEALIAGTLTINPL